MKKVNGLLILGVLLALGFISWFLYDEFENKIFLYLAIAFGVGFLIWRSVGSKGMGGRSNS